MRWGVRSAVAGLQVLALAAAASAVLLDLGARQGFHAVPVAQLQPAPPAEDLSAYRIGKAEERIRELGQEHSLPTYLLVGNLVAVVATLATYLVTTRRRSAPR